MSEVVVRAAAVADAERIAEIHVLSWQVAYRGQLPDAFLDALVDSLPQRREQRRRQLAQPSSPSERTLIAERDGRIVGFAMLGLCRDTDAAPMQGEVYAIYVEPESWDTGAGRELFKQATQALKALGYQAASLWVLETNKRARRFYEKAGWDTDGAEKVETRGEVVLREVRYRVTL